MSGAPIPDCDGGDGFACFKCEILCDNGTAPATSFIRTYVLDCSTGETISTFDTLLDGTTPYAVIGQAGICTGDINIPPTNVVDAELVCFDADPSPLIRVTVYNPTTGAIVAGPFFRDPVTGLPSPPAGSAIPCPDAEVDVEQEILCDDGFDPPVSFLRIYEWTEGTNTSVTDVELDGVTPYVLTGDAVLCATEIDNFPADAEYEILCDDDTDPPTPFLRRYDVDSVGAVTITDTGVDGTTPYVVAGSAVVCAVDIAFPDTITVDGTVDIGNWRDDAEFEVLCDFPPLFPGASIVQFLRRYDVDDAGVVTTTDTEIDGVTPYVPSVGGQVGSCGFAIRDFEPEILCDLGAANTQFARQYVETILGTFFTDTELDGSTPYAPVGPVGLCPVEVDGTVTVDGTVNIEAPDTSNGEVIRAGKVRLTGAGASWILGTDSGGGRVKSVTFICLNDGVGGVGSGVTVTDDFGNTSILNTGETVSWSVDALDSELDTTLRVDTTDPEARVDVLWTEVA